MDQLSEDEMPKLTPEEDKLWKAATKEYNRLKMIEHRAWQTDLSIKFKLKQAALAALPGEQKSAAPLITALHAPDHAGDVASCLTPFHCQWLCSSVYNYGSLACLLMAVTTVKGSVGRRHIAIAIPHNQSMPGLGSQRSWQ